MGVVLIEWKEREIMVILKKELYDSETLYENGEVYESDYDDVVLPNYSDDEILFEEYSYNQYDRYSDDDSVE